MNRNNIHKQTKVNYLTIIILIVVTLIIAYFLLFPDIFKDKNVKMEENMIASAKEYVLNNNISTSREIYIDSSKLNYALPENCNYISGVIFDGVNYTPNLVCDDYQSEVIKTNKDIKDFITLNGDEVMIVAKGMGFYDPGYNSKDIVNVVGNVGTEEGVYNIYYKTKNSNNVAIRKVIILDNPKLRTLYPTITLNDEEVVYIVEGNNYNDPGATARDAIDGNISTKVKIVSQVDNTFPGEYVINYAVTNSRGYSNTTTRKVIVISKNSDLTVSYNISPTTDTNEDVSIKLSVSGEYNKILYPDNTEGKSLTYVVNENGTYKFSVYDKYNRVIEKEVIIDNIDRTIPQGVCKGTMYYNRTEIKVTITTRREISSYEYVVDGVSSKSVQTNSYVSNKIKPSTVRVKIKDSINNQNEIVCSLENKLTRQIVTNAGGKNCLEGMTCYIQFNYGNASKYPFCSMSNLPNSCGGIGRNGCSITSATNAIAALGVKSKTGVLHNPYTVWNELYPINKRTGQCNGGCSGWTRIRDSIINAGLSAPKTVGRVANNTMSMITDHLKKGYPVIVYAQGKPFASGSAHYMTLLGIREDGYVFLSDSANVSGIKKAFYNNKQYYVDTWIPTSDLISGNVKEFLLVGPAGTF